MFGTLFGDKKFDHYIGKVDGIISKLSSLNDVRHDDIDELASSAIKQALDVNIDDSKEERIDGIIGDKEEPISNQAEISQLFSKITVPKEKLKKFALYDQIYDAVQLVKRIFTVYSDNVFLKDSVQNRVIFVKEHNTAGEEDKISQAKKFAERITNFYKLEDRLKKHTLHNLLKYGCSFIEVINLDDITVDMPIPEVKKKDDKGKLPAIFETIDYLLSTKSHIASKNKYRAKNIYNEIDSISEILFEFAEIDEVLAPLVTEQKNDKEEPEDKLSKIMLKFHNPHNIIVLETPYDTTLGYVEIRHVEKQSDTTTNPLASFVEIATKINVKGFGKGTKNIDNVLKLFVKSIVGKIIRQYELVPKSDLNKPMSQVKQEFYKQVEKQLEPVLLNSVKRLLVSVDESDLFYQKLGVRFIPADRMFRFESPNGESIVERLVYPGKLYLLTQLSNVVTKLSRASQIRKWTSLLIPSHSNMCRITP